MMEWMDLALICQAYLLAWPLSPTKLESYNTLRVHRRTYILCRAEVALLKLLNVINPSYFHLISPFHTNHFIDSPLTWIFVNLPSVPLSWSNSVYLFLFSHAKYVLYISVHFLISSHVYVFPNHYQCVYLHLPIVSPFEHTQNTIAQPLFPATHTKTLTNNLPR